MKIKRSDIGILPLLVSFPFMYYPKLLEGDTQPWVLIGALIALFTFRTRSFFNRRDLWLIGLAFLAIVTYAFRGSVGFFLLRHVYTYLTFIVLWVVCQRERGDFFPTAVKATVVIWFLIGLYQYAALNLGYEIEIAGRYLKGRMGPPSLAPEASYYGSLSMLQLMYLLSEQNRKNRIFIGLAVASVIMSGSLLAMILLVFVVWRLPRKWFIGVAVAVPLLIIADYNLTSAGVTSRLASITAEGYSIAGFFLDASLNLRVGHMYFTMVANLVPSLLLIGSVDFMAQYNAFAASTGFLIQTGTGYVLPAVGEMIYSAGIIGVLLLAGILNRAQENASTRRTKIEKVAFILACMMNPITISNAFLIVYAQAKT
jgi:hypothetical protein